MFGRENLTGRVNEIMAGQSNLKSALDHVHFHRFFSFFLRSFLPSFLLPFPSFIFFPLFFFFFFCFLGPYLPHMEFPRLKVQSELWQLTYVTATETQDPSCFCDLHHSSRQCWVLNPLSKARDRTHMSSILVGFISAEPQWELPFSPFSTGKSSPGLNY